MDHYKKNFATTASKNNAKWQLSLLRTLWDWNMVHDTNKQSSNIPLSIKVVIFCLKHDKLYKVLPLSQRIQSLWAFASIRQTCNVLNSGWISKSHQILTPRLATLNFSKVGDTSASTITIHTKKIIVNKRMASKVSLKSKKEEEDFKHKSWSNGGQTTFGWHQ